MLDLGTSFLASVARDPDALAIVDGDTRLTYRQWYERISALVAGFDELELEAGDHLVTLLQNRWEAATIHWACQFAGIVVTPINWRATAEELDFVLTNADAKALVYEEASARAVVSSKEAQHHPRISVGVPDDIPFISLVNEHEADVAPRANTEAWSVMLYTSGTTAKPKGVPRRQRAERAAALAHVAQNLYRNGERTLGVMPLYHTMGARSLLAMSLIGGTFVCLPRFDVAQALELIEREKITNLYLVPTLYHDLVHHPRFKPERVRSVRKLGFAGASMTDGLLKKLTAEFKPELFVNHYGSSEIYTFTIDQDAPKKPGSAGRAGINQMVRVVKLGAKSPDETAKPNEEGEIVALLAGDEVLRGLLAAARRRRQSAARWLVLHRRHRIHGRGWRPVRHRARRRHDHHRRRKRLAGRDRELPVVARGGVGGGGGRPRRRALGQDRHRLRQAQGAGQRRRFGPVLPDIRPRQLQTAAPLHVRRSYSQVAGRQAAAAHAGRRRLRARTQSAHRTQAMSETFTDPRLATLDGFRVEVDAARERADVILDRPPLNVVSMPQRDQLRLVFEVLDLDERVRVIVLRAVGENFSSGGNIKGFMDATPETVSKLAWNIAAPARCAKPVIVANRGFCFGVGFELSLACDFRIASETTQYALPEQRLGQIPGSGGSARLQKIVGITRTKDIVMRSRRIPAKQAYEWGIATECVPDGKLEAATDALVDELRAFSPLAQRTAKKLLNDTEDAMLSTRDRAGRPLLQPAAAIGRLPRRRRGVSC